MLVAAEELDARRQALEAAGGYPYPASQTPWQEMQRAASVSSRPAPCWKTAVKYQRIAQTQGVPRHNH